MNVRFLVARKGRELTQDQLAKQAELSQADISRIEKGGWIPPSDVQVRLSGLLGVPPRELFELDANLAAQRHA